MTHSRTTSVDYHYGTVTARISVMGTEFEQDETLAIELLDQLGKVTSKTLHKELLPRLTDDAAGKPDVETTREQEPVGATLWLGDAQLEIELTHSGSKRVNRDYLRAVLENYLAKDIVLEFIEFLSGKRGLAAIEAERGHVPQGMDALISDLERRLGGRVVGVGFGGGGFVPVG